MITFRKIEKKIAFLDLPRPTKIDCPENWSDIIKNPKKYKRIAGIPAAMSSASWLKMRIKNAGKPSTISQIPVVYKIAIKEVKTIAFLTRPYSFAP